MSILLRWSISAIIIFLVAYFVPGISVDNFYAALMVALFLGLVNAIIRPLLIFATLPFTIVTLGLWLFVVNGLLLWFISSWLKGFEIDNLWVAIVASALISIATWFMTSLFKNDGNK